MKISLTRNEINTLVEDLGLYYNDTLMESVYSADTRDILELYLETHFVMEGNEETAKSALSNLSDIAHKYISIVKNSLTSLNLKGSKILLKKIQKYEYSNVKKYINNHEYKKAFQEIKKLLLTSYSLYVTILHKYFREHKVPVVSSAVKTIYNSLTEGRVAVSVLLTSCYTAIFVLGSYYIVKLIIAAIKGIFNKLTAILGKAKNNKVDKATAKSVKNYKSLAKRLKRKVESEKKKKRRR